MTHVECAKMMRRIDNEVNGRYNAIGEELMRQYWEGMTHVVYHVHMPSLDNEDYFEPMQYYLISEFLAERMLNQGLERDAIIELIDGGYMWVRCGCGYSIYDDLERYFKD